MLLGERGADYIGFGAPSELRDQAGAVKRRLELVTWWAELFEIPCVAFDVAGLRDAQDLVAAGADFVTCRIGPGSSVSEALETVAAFTNALSDPLWEARP
jgi:thiamine-phosphate pyrophosphorylase